jgi:hypothetical protein
MTLPIRYDASDPLTMSDAPNAMPIAFQVADLAADERRAIADSDAHAAIGPWLAAVRAQNGGGQLRVVRLPFRLPTGKRRRPTVSLLGFV